MHTMNEQNYIIKSTSAEEVIEEIKAFLADEFGWVVEGNDVYVDEKKKIGLQFGISGASTTLCAINQDAKTGLRTIPLSNMAVIYHHTSYDNSTIYLSFGENNGVLFAKTEDGRTYAFISYSTNQIQFLSEDSIVIGNFAASGIVSESYRYAVQKMPAVLSGGVFKSLFNVYSAALGQKRNQLVSFSGEIFRFIYIHGNANSPFCAFKVSDDEV